MSKPTGGPAFPRAENLLRNSKYVTPHSGMTLRDWFAGQALVGLLSGDRIIGPGAWTVETFSKFAAERAYFLADTMLAERNAESGS